MSPERIAGTTFQHLRVILNLLEGRSEQLRHCVPREAGDTRFYQKPRWFLTNQATKSRHISKTVSCLGENSSSHTTSIFVEFKYSVIYGKMFFQQEITDAQVGTSHADCQPQAQLSNCMLRLPNQYSCYTLMQFFLAVKLNACMPAWILHKEKVIFFHEH